MAVVAEFAALPKAGFDSLHHRQEVTFEKTLPNSLSPFLSLFPSTPLSEKSDGSLLTKNPVLWKTLRLGR